MLGCLRMHFGRELHISDQLKISEGKAGCPLALISKDCLSILGSASTLPTKNITPKNSWDKFSDEWWIPVVIHAGLSVFGWKYCETLAELDLVPLLQPDKLPLDKRVVEGVDVGSDETSSPVDVHSCGFQVLLSQWGKVAVTKQACSLFTHFSSS